MLPKKQYWEKRLREAAQTFHDNDQKLPSSHRKNANELIRVRLNSAIKKQEENAIDEISIMKLINEAEAFEGIERMMSEILRLMNEKSVADNPFMINQLKKLTDDCEKIYGEYIYSVGKNKTEDPFSKKTLSDAIKKIHDDHELLIKLIDIKLIVENKLKKLESFLGRINKKMAAIYFNEPFSAINDPINFLENYRNDLEMLQKFFMGNQSNTDESLLAMVAKVNVVNKRIVDGMIQVHLKMKNELENQINILKDILLKRSDRVDIVLLVMIYEELLNKLIIIIEAINAKHLADPFNVTVDDINRINDEYTNFDLEYQEKMTTIIYLSNFTKYLIENEDKGKNQVKNDMEKEKNKHENIFERNKKQFSYLAAREAAFDCLRKAHQKAKEEALSQFIAPPVDAKKMAVVLEKLKDLKEEFNHFLALDSAVVDQTLFSYDDDRFLAVVSRDRELVYERYAESLQANESPKTRIQMIEKLHENLYQQHLAYQDFCKIEGHVNKFRKILDEYCSSDAKIDDGLRVVYADSLKSCSAIINELTILDKNQHLMINEKAERAHVLRKTFDQIPMVKEIIEMQTAVYKAHAKFIDELKYHQVSEMMLGFDKKDYEVKIHNLLSEMIYSSYGYFTEHAKFFFSDYFQELDNVLLEVKKIEEYGSVSIREKIKLLNRLESTVDDLIKDIPVEKLMRQNFDNITRMIYLLEKIPRMGGIADKLIKINKGATIPVGKKHKIKDRKFEFGLWSHIVSSNKNNRLFAQYELRRNYLMIIKTVEYNLRKNYPEMFVDLPNKNDLQDFIESEKIIFTFQERILNKKVNDITQGIKKLQMITRSLDSDSKESIASISFSGGQEHKTVGLFDKSSGFSHRKKLMHEFNAATSVLEAELNKAVNDNTLTVDEKITQVDRLYDAYLTQEKNKPGELLEDFMGNPPHGLKKESVDVRESVLRESNNQYTGNMPHEQLVTTQLTCLKVKECDAFIEEKIIGKHSLITPEVTEAAKDQLINEIYELIPNIEVSENRHVDFSQAEKLIEKYNHSAISTEPQDENEILESSPNSNKPGLSDGGEPHF